MSDRMFGRLEALDPKTLWNGGLEALIAWLAEADSLELLAEALDLDMEVEAADRAVGPLTADLICRDIRNDSRVLIEVQLSDTDNDYLGRLIAHAAGLEAGKIVWIATHFREEHRAALDWLNRLSPSKLSFYAPELQAFRVNGSTPAPRFHLLSRPNDWTRSARRGVRITKTEELSEGRRYQLGLVGPAGASARARRAEIVLSGEAAVQRYVAALQQGREAIEATVGYPLEWVAALEGRDHRICVTAKGADIARRADWARQHQWLAERLEELYRAFAGRLRVLDERPEVAAWSRINRAPQPYSLQ